MPFRVKCRDVNLSNIEIVRKHFIKQKLQQLKKTSNSKKYNVKGIHWFMIFIGNYTYIYMYIYRVYFCIFFSECEGTY